MARYSLFVLKVPLNCNQPTREHPTLKDLTILVYRPSEDGRLSWPGFDYRRNWMETRLLCCLLTENIARTDLSHPIHSDNCIIQPDNTCKRVPPAYTSRDYRWQPSLPVIHSRAAM